MKSVNNELALLAVLLLLLTSLSTVSGSMPTIQSIETYFEEPKPNKGKPVSLSEPVEGFKGNPSSRPPTPPRKPPRKPPLNKPFRERFGVNPGTDSQGGVSLGAAYGVDKEDIKELTEGFNNQHKLIEPFQGNLYANV